MGTLACPAGLGYPRDTDPYPFALRGRRLAWVTALELSGPALITTVEPLARPGKAVSSSDVAALKGAFAAYVKRGVDYRQAVPHPDYEAERVAATDSPSALTNILLHHVKLPESERKRLLPLPDAGRVRRLLAFLKRAGSVSP